jgi:RNA polymerase sigma-70 factor (ECF subfamily)
MGKVVKDEEIGMTGSADRTNEAELVERLRYGDLAAMEELFNTYFDRLYSLVFHEVGRDQAVAEDVTQEIFLNVLTSIGKFRGQSKLYTWLCSIAHHKIADFYRRQERERKYRKRASSTGNIEPEQIPDTGRPIPNMTESEETRHAVEQALLRLPLDYRQVLILKYVEEMSVQEISQIMHRSPKSVEGLLARARKALRARLVTSSEGFR